MSIMVTDCETLLQNTPALAVCMEMFHLCSDYSRTSEQRTLWDHGLCPLFRGCLIFALSVPASRPALKPHVKHAVPASRPALKVAEPPS